MGMLRTGKFRASLLLVWAGMLLSATACSNSNSNNGAQSASPTVPAAASSSTAQADGSPFGKYPEPVVYTIGGTTVSKVPDGESYEDNKYTRYIADRVNVKPKFVWTVDPNTYDQKVALTITSGDLPDVMMINDRKTLKQLVDAGLVADLTEAYQKTISPMLKEMYDSFGGRLLEEATFDGKLMALPGTNIGGAHNLLWIRQDWLDKLGLQPPKTMEDIVRIAKAFMEQDPGGNGAGKTIGITGKQEVAGIYNSMHGLDTLFSLYGAYPRQWVKDAAGKVVYGSVAPEMKQALSQLNELYKNGILDPQFALRKSSDSTALLASGKAGIMFGAWWAPYDALRDSVVNNPQADWRPYLAPLDDDGNLNVYSQDPVNKFLVVRKGFEHPEAIIKALNAENELYRAQTPEAVKVLEQVAANNEQPMGPLRLQIDYNDVVYRFYTQLKEALDSKDPSKLPNDMKSAYDAVIKNNENPGASIDAWTTAISRVDGQALTYVPQIKSHDNVFFGTTPTMELKWANLEKLENEALVQFIMGAKSVDEFDAFVSEWKRLGGDEITQEVQNSLK